MSDYDLNALFHPNVELSSDKTTSKAGEYKPSADRGQNGVYKAVIRFVSWWQDPQHSYTSKWSCWLVDPMTNRGRLIDCPSTIGKPSPLQDMFFKLRKSESVQEQKKSEIFSRKPVYSAVIQVIKDVQNTEAEGKLFIYTFGKKIFEKYEAEKKPVIGEPGEPFDLLDGKAFALVITKVAGFNNYDQSRFLDTKVPLLLPSPEGKLVPINEKTPRETVLNFLKENTPDFTKYGYKEWDLETHDYVNQIILAVTGQVPSSNYADIRNNVTEASKTSVKTGITTSELTINDLNLDDVNSVLPSLDIDLPDLNTNNDFGLPGDLESALGNI